MTSLLSCDFVKPFVNQLSILINYHGSIGSLFKKKIKIKVNCILIMQSIFNNDFFFIISIWVS